MTKRKGTTISFSISMLAIVLMLANIYETISRVRNPAGPATPASLAISYANLARSRVGLHLSEAALVVMFVQLVFLIWWKLQYRQEQRSAKGL